jgi:hypothetical protein
MRYQVTQRGQVTRRGVLWLAGASALSPIIGRPAFAGSAAGNVVAVQGSCVVEGQGGTNPLTIGHPIAVGDAIRTPADGGVKMAMSDGSWVSVAANTRVAVTTYQIDASGMHGSAVLTLAQGLLRAAAPADHAATFQVATAVGSGAAHGTDWFIETQPGWAQVGVMSGSVSLSSATTGHSVTIPSRWGARLEAGHDPVSARVWAPAEFQAVIARTDIR